METNKDSPKAPSQATNVKKNIVRYVSLATALKKITINQKVPSIINSSLNKALSKCLWVDTKAINPQKIIIIGTVELNRIKVVIRF